MKKIVLNFNQYLAESSSDFDFTSIVRDVLLRNQKRIMVEANVSSDVFDLVFDKMQEERPESLDEEDLVNDAMAYAISIQPKVQAEENWKEMASGLSSEIPQFEN